MIVCNCGKKIEYFVAIAHAPFTSVNSNNKPIIITGGSFFLCEECAKQKINWWQAHNRGRIEPYLIQSVKVNVIADTKKLFLFRVGPQLYNQFKKINWWLPKTDIARAVSNARK